MKTVNSEDGLKEKAGHLRKLSVLLLALLAVALLMAGCQAEPAHEDGETEMEAEEAGAAEEAYVIGIVTLVSHPSLDAIRQGTKDRLAEEEFVDGENVTFVEGNAEGDIASLSTIVQQFLDQDVDVIVATTTPALQAAYNLTQENGRPPIIFNGVSNPYTAGIAAAPDDHPAWVFGNQLLDPVADAMALMEEVMPAVQTVGLIYNPAEANSTYLVEIAEGVAAERGLTLEMAPVSNSSEIQTAAESLVTRGIDAYLAINDNTLTSGFEALVQVGNENKVPIFGTSASMPQLGAAASYGVNPYQEGLDSGQMVADFLRGDLDIASATIQVQDAVLLTVNPAAAAAQGIELPSSLIDRADTVIDG